MNEKPRVPHAGCRAQGLVHLEQVDGQKVMLCDGCGKRITDPMELAPRGSVFTPYPRTTPRMDFLSTF